LGGGKEQIEDSGLRYYAYRKLIADKMVFVRFLGQRTNFGGPDPRGYLAVSFYLTVLLCYLHHCYQIRKNKVVRIVVKPARYTVSIKVGKNVKPIIYCALRTTTARWSTASTSMESNLVDKVEVLYAEELKRNLRWDWPYCLHIYFGLKLK